MWEKEIFGPPHYHCECCDYWRRKLEGALKEYEDAAKRAGKQVPKVVEYPPDYWCKDCGNHHPYVNCRYPG